MNTGVIAPILTRFKGMQARFKRPKSQKGISTPKQGLLMGKGAYSVSGGVSLWHKGLPMGKWQMSHLTKCAPWYDYPCDPYDIRVSFTGHSSVGLSRDSDECHTVKGMCRLSHCDHCHTPPWLSDARHRVGG